MLKNPMLLLFLCPLSISPTHAPINFLYAHSFGDSSTEVFRYMLYNRKGRFNRNALIRHGSVFTFNFPDVSPYFWRINPYQTSLAQDNDIRALHNAYAETMITVLNNNMAPDTILLGLSRGASTIINFMALYNPEHIKAIILESPFDHMNTIVNHKLADFNLSGIPIVNILSHLLIRTIFKQYKPKGTAPINCIHTLNPHVPILMICSREDAVVPYESTLSLYKKLKAHGHQHAYLLVLEHGKHAFALFGADGDMYAATVHAFYKKYMLPHDETLANRGVEVLKKCQEW